MPVFMITELIDTENEKSKDKWHVVIDAQYDSFRENIIWVLVFHDKFKIYILRAYCFNLEAGPGNKGHTAIIEDHVISP
jgi:hypothetical protein